MANKNIKDLKIKEIELFRNGERANEDNLNRPIKQLRDNQKSITSVIEDIKKVLDSGDVNLDELKEIADKVKEFQAILKSNDENFDSIQEIVNQLKNTKKQVDNEHNTAGEHIYVDRKNKTKYRFFVEDDTIKLEEV